MDGCEFDDNGDVDSTEASVDAIEVGNTIDWDSTPCTDESTIRGENEDGGETILFDGTPE